MKMPAYSFGLFLVTNLNTYNNVLVVNIVRRFVIIRNNYNYISKTYTKNMYFGLVTVINLY